MRAVELDADRLQEVLRRRSSRRIDDAIHLERRKRGLPEADRDRLQRQLGSRLTSEKRIGRSWRFPRVELVVTRSPTRAKPRQSRRDPDAACNRDLLPPTGDGPPG